MSDKNTHDAQYRQRSSHERIRIARPRDYAHVQSMLAMLRHFVSVHAHTVIYIYVCMYTYTPYIMNNKSSGNCVLESQEKKCLKKLVDDKIAKSYNNLAGFFSIAAPDDDNECRILFLQNDSYIYNMLAPTADEVKSKNCFDEAVHYIAAVYRYIHYTGALLYLNTNFAVYLYSLRHLKNITP